MATFDELDALIRTTANYQGFRRRAAFRVFVGSGINEASVTAGGQVPYNLVSSDLAQAQRIASQITGDRSAAGSALAAPLYTNQPTIRTVRGPQQMIDISDWLDPHLISIQVVDHDGDEVDSCSIELDDREGRLAIPPNDVPIEIWLGWVGEDLGIVFHGYVYDCESGCARRGGGRRLWIEGKGQSPNGMQTSPMKMNWGDGEGQDIPLSQMLSSAAGNAGLSMKIDPSLGALTRKYWAQQNESFNALGNRIAEMVGGNFKINGNVATLVKAEGGTNAEGSPMPSVVAEWNVNLISWRIKPFVSRPQASQAASSFFDKAKGLWGSVEQAIGGQVPFGMAEGIAGLPSAAPNKQIGEQINDGVTRQSEGERGCGNATINGEPDSKANGRLKVIGARDGVDGIYSIKSAEHTYSRSGGYISRCELKNPTPNPRGYTPDWHERKDVRDSLLAEGQRRLAERQFEAQQQEAQEAADRMRERRLEREGTS